MKKQLLIIVILFGSITLSFGQDYENAIGLRGGLYNGVTFKHFLGESSAVEAMLFTRWNGFAVSALYEIHSYTAFDVPRLNWYYGIGGHVGLFDGTYVSWLDNTVATMVIGVDAILGIEYNFEEIPINISLDYKPAFNLIGDVGFWGDGGAFSIRYLF